MNPAWADLAAETIALAAVIAWGLLAALTAVSAALIAAALMSGRRPW